VEKLDDANLEAPICQMHSVEPVRILLNGVKEIL
jgi:hypothetical protein